jgi:hypothetical protein
MHWLSSYNISLRDLVEIAKSIVSMAALLVGGVWAYRLFWLKRQRYPRITIEHQIIHKPLTAERTLLNVTVNLSNDGDVLAELKSGEIWIQQILPLPPNFAPILDEGRDMIRVLRELIAEESKVMWQTEIAWPVIADYSMQFKAWHRKEVEPGSQLQLRYDFVLDNRVSLIKMALE